MDYSERFQEGLDWTAELVEDIGHDVYEKNIPELMHGTVRGTEYSFTGHRCDAELGRYLILGHPELRFMSVLYILSVSQNIAEDLDDDLARAVVDVDTVDDESVHTKAAEVLLNHVDREPMEALKTQLYMFMSGGEVEINLFDNDSGALEFFTVESLFFPYEDSFGIQDFSTSVRNAISAGNRGSRLLPRSIVIKRDDDDLSNSELVVNLTW